MAVIRGTGRRQTTSERRQQLRLQRAGALRRSETVIEKQRTNERIKDATNRITLELENIFSQVKNVADIDKLSKETYNKLVNSVDPLIRNQFNNIVLSSANKIKNKQKQLIKTYELRLEQEKASEKKYNEKGKKARKEGKDDTRYENKEREYERRQQATIKVLNELRSGNILKTSAINKFISREGEKGFKELKVREKGISQLKKQSEIASYVEKQIRDKNKVPSVNELKDKFGVKAREVVGFVDKAKKIQENKKSLETPKEAKKEIPYLLDQTPPKSRDYEFELKLIKNSAKSVLTDYQGLSKIVERKTLDIGGIKIPTAGISTNDLAKITDITRLSLEDYKKIQEGKKNPSRFNKEVTTLNKYTEKYSELNKKALQEIKKSVSKQKNNIKNNILRNIAGKLNQKDVSLLDTIISTRQGDEKALNRLLKQNLSIPITRIKNVDRAIKQAYGDTNKLITLSNRLNVVNDKIKNNRTITVSEYKDYRNGINDLYGIKGLTSASANKIKDKNGLKTYLKSWLFVGKVTVEAFKEIGRDIKFIWELGNKFGNWSTATQRAFLTDALTLNYDIYKNLSGKDKGAVFRRTRNSLKPLAEVGKTAFNVAKFIKNNPELSTLAVAIAIDQGVRGVARNLKENPEKSIGYAVSFFLDDLLLTGGLGLVDDIAQAGVKLTPKAKKILTSIGKSLDPKSIINKLNDLADIYNKKLRKATESQWKSIPNSYLKRAKYFPDKTHKYAVKSPRGLTIYLTSSDLRKYAKNLPSVKTSDDWIEISKQIEKAKKKLWKSIDRDFRLKRQDEYIRRLKEQKELAKFKKGERIKAPVLENELRYLDYKTNTYKFANSRSERLKILKNQNKLVEQGKLKVPMKAYDLELRLKGNKKIDNLQLDLSKGISLDIDNDVKVIEEVTNKVKKQIKEKKTLDDVLKEIKGKKVGEFTTKDGRKAITTSDGKVYYFKKTQKEVETKVGKGLVQIQKVEVYQLQKVQQILKRKPISRTVTVTLQGKKVKTKSLQKIKTLPITATDLKKVSKTRINNLMKVGLIKLAKTRLDKISLSKAKLLNIAKVKVEQKVEQLAKQKVSQKQLSKLKVELVSKLKTKSPQQLKQIINNPTKLKEIQKLKTIKVKKVDLKKKKKLDLDLEFGSRKGLKKGELLTFDGRVRIRGKTRKIRLNLTLNRALRYMIKLIDNTTARSFDLILKGKSKQKDIQKPRGLRKFRKRISKNRQVLRFVEKTEFAIDTPGEKRGLKLSKALKRGKNVKRKPKKSKTSSKSSSKARKKGKTSKKKTRQVRKKRRRTPKKIVKTSKAKKKRQKIKIIK